MSDTKTDAEVEIDRDVCQAYGVCAQIAPEVYELDDDGYVMLVGNGTVTPALLGRAREAADACPVRAIRLTVN
ncbi:ferredoxin [Rhodococcus opacus]|nr:ferredoxin [Rhodococcus opacus]